ncbi:hypothetical protein KP509_04G061800 [Ceratopteris richardii]|uniref:DUF7950 domain-containing protein n=1 Tax=Ceratopteris richardii TaxID=49495 RepID=A0A8T2V0Z7_CERRI|nr:hypothetical protein KP509_04G061800 [Ceratopteris richardii]
MAIRHPCWPWPHVSCVKCPHSSHEVYHVSCTDISCTRIIVPEPRRPVCSVISVETITAISNAKLELKYSSEHVESQLEASNLPGLIADLLNVVRWVNTAYKAMVGHVTAFGTEHSRRMLAWQFDIHAGLGLTCPA